MRHLMLTLVFVLSVSARCVKKQNANKLGPALGKQGMKQAGSQAGSGGTLSTTNNSGTNDTLTPIGSENLDRQSNGQQSSSTTSGTSSSTTNPPDSGQTPSPDSNSSGSNSGSSSSSNSSSSSTDASSTGSTVSGTTSSSGSGNMSSPGSSDTSSSGTNTTSSSGTDNTSSSGTNNTSNPLTPQATGGGGASGSCGPMKGVCFNSGMQPSMYDKMTTAANWITFGMDIPGGPGSSRVQQDHIPMMAFKEHVAAAVKLVNGPNPPEWLLTFNEPDFSYGGFTPTMSGKEAAAAIKDLLASPGSKTKFVAPATADPNHPFLEEFFAECKCKDFFSAYSMHQYNPSSAQIISNIEAYHGKWNDKPLWITEIAPGGANCGMGWDDVGKFMKEVYKFAKGSGFVEKVFWNTGNQIDPKDHNVCNSWLVDGSGNPGPLFDKFQAIDCS
ncbi:MAG: hypothetical protein Q9223_002975 [Gallowayella weberi]